MENEAQSKSASPRITLLLRVFAGILLGGFALVVLRYQWNGVSDFDQLYLAGSIWREGRSPYEVSGPYSFPDGPQNRMHAFFYYSPLGALLGALLSLFPFPVATALWRVGCFSLLLTGLWFFMRLTLPRWSVESRAALLGVLAWAGSIRWNLIQLQSSVLIVGALLWFACAVAEKRSKLAVVFGTLVSVKITYLFPVVALLLFRKQYRLLGATLGCIALVNGVGLVPTGFTETIASYRRNLPNLNVPGSPFVPNARLYSAWQRRTFTVEPGQRWKEPPGDQVHFQFIFSAWTGETVRAQQIHLVASLGVFGLLALLWLRLKRLPDSLQEALTLPFFVTLTLASLLIVYHQRYDAITLLPLAILALARLDQNWRDGLSWAILGISAFYAWALFSRALTWWQDFIVARSGVPGLIPLSGYLTLTAFLLGWALTWRESRTERQAVVTAFPPNDLLHSARRQA